MSKLLFIPISSVRPEAMSSATSHHPNQLMHHFIDESLGRNYVFSWFDVFLQTGGRVIPHRCKPAIPAILLSMMTGFNYLTKMYLTNMRGGLLKWWSCQTKGCTVKFGCNDHFEQYLNEGADFYSAGEAERTLAELITALDSEKRRFSSLSGHCFQTNRMLWLKLWEMWWRTSIHFLFLHWDLIDVEAYKSMAEEQGLFFL